MVLLLLLGALALPTVLWVVLYFASQTLIGKLAPVDVKKKYDAEWALVTGCGSGIGRALVEKLALQGMNVVMVSLPNDIEDAHATMCSQFPQLQFRKVGVVFAEGEDYMQPILEATQDICVQCIFNNAGYVVTGFFETQPVEKHANNIECNATAAVRITHHFVQRLINEQKRGCVVFTSSAAAYIPTPFTAMYGATKAFLSQFAVSLAVEVRNRGIDVSAVHPSPVASNFYAGASHKIDMLEQAQKAAVSPDVIPNKILRSIGRCHLYDIGDTAVAIRSCTAFLPYNILAFLFSAFAPFLKDYKEHDKNRAPAK